MTRQGLDIFDLTGKVAIVTGGSQGAGFAISQGLAKAGCDIVIANRNVEKGVKAAETIALQEGVKCVQIQTDVTVQASVQQLVGKVLNDFGKIDILVNNAAVEHQSSMLEAREKWFDRSFNSNVKGPMFCMQAVAEDMIRRRKGKIINISSFSITKARGKRAIYGSSKAALSHMSTVAAMEWVQYNIQVNAICLGVFDGESFRAFGEKFPEEHDSVVASIPAGRPLRPEELHGLVIYLASDASNYMTGRDIYIDGGAGW